MSNRGRKPIPDHLKVIQGTLKRSRVKATLQPSEKMPLPSSWLNKRAKGIFKKVAGRLNDMGLASASHTEALALLSSRQEEVERYDKYLSANGATYETTGTSGQKMIKERPEVMLRERAFKHLHALLVDFGLTPSASAKVPAAKRPEKPSRAERFFKDEVDW